MTSFVANGHAVNLYVYDRPAGIPAGVRVRDAGTILPRECLFVHRGTGSPAPFADWFRYRVVYEHGGIWADSDVVCLQPFAYPTEEVFAWGDERVINNGVLGLPRGHELAAWMSECCRHPNGILPYDGPGARLRKWRRRYLEGDRRSNVEWGEYGPEGLTQAARYLGYAGRALPVSHFYPIGHQEWRSIFFAPATRVQARLAGSTAVHLWNQMTRLDPAFGTTSRIAPDSLFEVLCARYRVGGVTPGAVH